MSRLNAMVEDFLAQKRIAVAGVSHTDASQAANMIYRKLRGAGYQVFALNPSAQEVEGDTCYPDLKAVPEKVDGIVISTPPEAADKIVQQCAEVGVSRVWLHRSFGTGSLSPTAVKFCEEKGISVIAGGCPMMFCEPVDFGHKCMRWMLRLTGGLPK
jgi:predicted CoA-binding protein